MTADEILMIQVQAMSELEKASFIEKLVDHLGRNEQLHLISDCYEFEDPELDELRDEILVLETDIRELKFDKQVLEDLLEKATATK